MSCLIRIGYGARRLRGVAVSTIGAVILICFVGSTPANAQLTPVGVGLSSDQETVTVGDVFLLTLSASYPQDHHVVFPDVPAQWGEFEVRGTTPVPTVADGDGGLRSAIEIEVALFQPGVHATPALSVAVRRPDGSVINRPARPIEVRVESVLARGANELKDIRPQADVPFPVVWPWAVGGATGLAMLMLLAGYYWRRKTTPTDILVQQRALTPLEAALETLDRIEKLDLPARSRYTDHYTMVANCLRTYLFGQFRIPANELTTEQSVAVLDRTPVAPTDVRDLGGVLEEADLVKFARLRPDRGDARELVQTGRRVVSELAAAPSRFRPASGYSSGRYRR